MVYDEFRYLDNYHIAALSLGVLCVVLGVFILSYKVHRAQLLICRPSPYRGLHPLSRRPPARSTRGDDSMVLPTMVSRAVAATLKRQKSSLARQHPWCQGRIKSVGHKHEMLHKLALHRMRPHTTCMYSGLYRVQPGPLVVSMTQHGATSDRARAMRPRHQSNRIPTQLRRDLQLSTEHSVLL